MILTCGSSRLPDPTWRPLIVHNLSNPAALAVDEQNMRQASPAKGLTWLSCLLWPRLFVADPTASKVFWYKLKAWCQGASHHLLPSVESTGAAQQIPRHRGLRAESSIDFCNLSISFNSALLLPTGLQHVAAENMIAKGMAVSQAKPPSEESPLPPKAPTSNVSCRCRQGTCSFLAVWSQARLSPGIALSTSRQACYFL